MNATARRIALAMLALGAFARAAAAPWIEGSRFATNGLAVSGPWTVTDSGVRADAGATLAFGNDSARRFYLKARFASAGTFQLSLNGESLELGDGIRIRPGGGMNWSALPEQTRTDRDRNTLEVICQDNCLDVWLDSASAGFGSWKNHAGLTNGSLRVLTGHVTFSWLEWRGIQPRPAMVAASTPDQSGPTDPTDLDKPTPPLPPPPSSPVPPPSPAPPAPAIATIPPPAPVPPSSPAPPPSPVPPSEDPMSAVKALLRKPRGITWVFAGDSITLGGHFTGGGRSYPEHFQERIRWEMRRFDDAVINAAFNGATTDKLARVLDERVLRHRPQVVFLMIGSNDARRGLVWLPRFREWLDILLTRMRDAGAIVILQTANHPVSNRDERLLMEDAAYMDAVRAVAKEHGVPLVDHWSLWETFHADHEGHYNWMGDAIHPNARGHLQMALDLFRALGLYDHASRLVKLGEEP